MYQVNREDRLSSFSIYQAKRLSYPIVYQSYRIVRGSCSIVRVFYRIVRLSYPIVYLVKNKVAGTVQPSTAFKNCFHLICAELLH